MDPNELKKAAEKDLKAYKKLKSLNRNEDFDLFFELLLKSASEKMLWAFTGDNVKNYDDFCKIRGEVVAYLYPIQEVRSADAMVKHLQEQLDNFYNNSN